MPEPTTARDVVRRIYSEYHGQPVDPWAAPQGPGRWAEEAERIIGEVMGEAAEARSTALGGMVGRLADMLEQRLGDWEMDPPILHEARALLTQAAPRATGCTCPAPTFTVQSPSPVHPFGSVRAENLPTLRDAEQCPIHRRAAGGA